MIRRRFLTLTAAVSLASLVGCNRTRGIVDPNVDYYTCTMHPSVHSHDPSGKCPICSMDLVPVMKKGIAAAPVTGPQTSEFRVPVERQQQIGVTYATVEKKPLRRTIRSVGVIAPDKSRRWEFVARVEGYVQRLHVTSPGESVIAGQPLLEVYSPELAAAERELVNLLEARDRTSTGDNRTNSDRLIQAARRRLEQWNITAEQIADLEKTRKPSETLTFLSPFAGVIGNLPVEQGRKVAVGDPLADVVDLSVVWLWAEFFEDEFSTVSKGQKVQVTTKAIPGQAFPGEVALVDPFINESSRTIRARVDLPNPGSKLRPGMYADLELTIDGGEALAIPTSAVMPTGTRTLVFVDKGEGKLEPRFAQLGQRFGDFYQVMAGLNEGERVVASANFLIDAESKVQGAVKAFTEPTPSSETKP